MRLWFWRLWVRLTSKRATREDIAGEKIDPNEMDQACRKLIKEMDRVRNG